VIVQAEQRLGFLVMTVFAWSREPKAQVFE